MLFKVILTPLLIKLYFFVMKKLFCFLAVAGTALFTSCSSDDDNSTTPVEEVTGITLTANSATGLVGDEFTFTVKNNLNADVTSESTIFVDDVEIEGNTFTAAAEGTYTVHAVNGEFTSPDVTITITEETVEVTSLKVTYDTQVVTVGETITFTATANGTIDVTAGATFFVDGEAIEGNSFSSDAVGVHQITASYEGYTTDEENEEEYAVVAFIDTVTFTESDVNNSALLYFGRFPADGGFVDYFSIISYEGTESFETLEATDNYLDVEVIVPVAENDPVTLPSGDNASFYQIYQLIKGGNTYPILTVETGSVTGVTEGLTAASETAMFNIQSTFNGNIAASSINLNYDGAFDSYYDQSELGRGTTSTLEGVRAARAKFMSK